MHNLFERLPADITVVVTTWILMPLIGIAGAITIPSLCVDRITANEHAAIAACRQIASAQLAYWRQSSRELSSVASSGPAAMDRRPSDVSVR